MLATGTVGATVMPHALYLHSALTQARTPAGDGTLLRRMVRVQRLDLAVAMTIAGSVNVAMLVVAAEALPAANGTGDGITTYQAELARTLGSGADGRWSSRCLRQASRRPEWGHAPAKSPWKDSSEGESPIVRRMTTPLPCLVLLACGMPATAALVVHRSCLDCAYRWLLSCSVRRQTGN